METCVHSAPESQKDDSGDNDNPMPYPKNGQCHIRIDPEEWDIIQELRNRRGTSLNETINYLARYYEAYPVDIEIALDRLASIEAHTKLVEDWHEDLINGLDGLNSTLAETPNSPTSKTSRAVIGEPPHDPRQAQPTHRTTGYPDRLVPRRTDGGTHPAG